jgi:hypothetical protein
MIDKNFEIAENAEILIDKDFDSKLVQLEGIKLGDDYKTINLLLPNMAEVQMIIFTDADYKALYRIEQFEDEFKEHNGYIHIARKFGFVIKNQKITEIMMYGKCVDNLKQYNIQKIIDIHGNPRKIWVIDDEDEKILAYSDKKLYFFVDRYAEIIREVRVGDVNEEPYSRWENI